MPSLPGNSISIKTTLGRDLAILKSRSEQSVKTPVQVRPGVPLQMASKPLRISLLSSNMATLISIVVFIKKQKSNGPYLSPDWVKIETQPDPGPDAFARVNLQISV